MPEHPMTSAASKFAISDPPATVSNLTVPPRSLSSRVIQASKLALIAPLEYFWTVWLHVLILLRNIIRLFQLPLAYLITGCIILSFSYLAGCFVIALLTSALPAPFFPFIKFLFRWFKPSISFATSIISQPLTPLCGLAPFFCRLPAFLGVLSDANTWPLHLFSTLTDAQGDAFDTLTNTSVAGSGIALDISRLGAIALPELISMIRHSNITGKDVLIDALGDLSDQAPLTTRSLQQFGTAVDQSLAVVLATNKVAMRRIEARIYRHSYWTSGSTVPNSQVFERAINVFEGVVDTLNIAAVACNHDLDRMLSLLGAVATIVRELRWEVTWERDVLLAELWTFFGGNRARLAGYNRDIKWLEDALIFEKKAQSNILQARLTLNRMSGQIWDLKRKFGEPSINSEDHDGLEIHYEVLVLSIHQLTKIQARSLEGDESYYQAIRL